MLVGKQAQAQQCWQAGVAMLVLQGRQAPGTCACKSHAGKMSESGRLHLTWGLHQLLLWLFLDPLWLLLSLFRLLLDLLWLPVDLHQLPLSLQEAEKDEDEQLCTLGIRKSGEAAQQFAWPAQLHL